MALRYSLLRAAAAGKWARPRALRHLLLLPALGCLALFPRHASAGAVLLARDTVIHSSGTGFDQQQAISHFDRFADGVGIESGPNGLVTMSNQNSAVGVQGLNGIGFSGGFGEGQVRSMAPGGGSAAAQSNMDLIFMVSQAPSAYTIGGAMGSLGSGATLMELSQITTGQPIQTIFSSKTSAGEGGAAGASREISKSGFLAPGEYALHVHATSQDLTRNNSESNAYYTFSFSLSDASVGGLGGGSGPPVAVPLPPAAAAGAALLALIAGRRISRRTRRA